MNTYRAAMAGALALSLSAGPVASAVQQAAPREEGPRMAFEEFMKLVPADGVLIVDVRDAESYRNGHIPGAISIPLGEIPNQVERLKKEKRPIVTYCA